MKLWIIVLLFSLLAPNVTAQTQPREVAFINVNVVPVTSERILTGHTVLVRGDRIVSIGPSAKLNHSALKVQRFQKGLKVPLFEDECLAFLVR